MVEYRAKPSDEAPIRLREAIQNPHSIPANWRGLSAVKMPQLSQTADGRRQLGNGEFLHKLEVSGTMSLLNEERATDMLLLSIRKSHIVIANRRPTSIVAAKLTK